MNKKFYFIQIEGTDGCGKQTQANLLKQALTLLGFNVVSLSFPNYSSEGCGAVKMYLRGEFGDNANDVDAYQASSFFMVDRLTTMLKLKNEIGDGDIIICDRYVESNLIHQASKLNEDEQDEYANWLINTEYNILKLPKADLILFLNMPIDVSLNFAHSRTNLKTGDSKDIHENNNDYLIKSYKTGLKYAKILGWEIIDCAENGNPKTIEEINKNILKVVTQKLEKFKNTL